MERGVPPAAQGFDARVVMLRVTVVLDELVSGVGTDTDGWASTAGARSRTDSRRCG